MGDDAWSMVPVEGLVACNGNYNYSTGNCFTRQRRIGENMTTQQTKQERKRLKREAVIAKQVAEKEAKEVERQSIIIRAAKLAGVSLKQIEDGHIKPQFRGERGDEVSFVLTIQRKNYFSVLHAEGAFDPHDYSHTVDRFYGAWRAHMISVDAYGAKLSDGGGAEAPNDEALRLYSHLLKHLTRLDMDMMQFLVRDRDEAINSETRKYLMHLTAHAEYAIKGAETQMEALDNILAREKKI